MEAGVCSLQTRNGGEKDFRDQEPHRVLLSFTNRNEVISYYGLNFISILINNVDHAFLS